MEPLGMFRFTIRDMLWLTVVGGLQSLLWLEKATLHAVRIHAGALQHNLLVARWHYGPSYDEGNSIVTVEAVDWKLADQKIP